MEDDLNSIIADASAGVVSLSSRADFDQFKSKIVGPNGSLTKLKKNIGKMPKEERPVLGKLINTKGKEIEAILSLALEKIEDLERFKEIGSAVDPTLPVPDGSGGSYHLLTQVREEICSILHKVGFVVAEGPEAETEYYCFDALNTPPDHPARDLHDTYYLTENVRFGNVSKHDDERYLLRTHTSSVQIRTMLKTPPPLRIISPGRCFRRDTADATHSASFHQIEGLYVDKNVTVKDLKAMLDYFLRSLLGENAKTRFRPHFFPYTEPSFEVDFNASHLAKLGKEWIEIAGCGMVDPEVFKSVGYDPEEWTGFAFGMGIERIAMILYGIDDIRYFYQNDLRFLKQFG